MTYISRGQVVETRDWLSIAALVQALWTIVRAIQIFIQSLTDPQAAQRTGGRGSGNRGPSNRGGNGGPGRGPRISGMGTLNALKGGAAPTGG